MATYRINYEVTHLKAKTPRKAYMSDVGYDVYSIEDVVIPPGKTVWARTGIKLGMPRRLYCKVFGRSGLAGKGIHVGAGLIDSGFRDEIKICLVNTSAEEWKGETGTRIAQLVFEKKPLVELVAGKVRNDTQRGKRGFGSTGLKDEDDINVNKKLCADNE